MKHILGQAALSTVLLTNPQLAANKEYIVQILPAENGSYYFNPKKLFIKDGDTVTWVNLEDKEHKIILEKAPRIADIFESQPLKQYGEKWSYTFKTSGTYLYNGSSRDPMVKGVIIVDKPSTPIQMREIDKNSNDSGQ